jgi:ssDNA-binding replication factor A large subunit
MKKAKSEIEFNDLLEKLFDKLKAKSLEFIDFDKLEQFMEKQIDKCRVRRAKRKAKNE